MTALFVLIGLSLLTALGFLVAFIWSVRKGQYDDDYTPAIRILFDDGQKPERTKQSDQSPSPV
jgi:cbb3-type cytochrome oxidase maturation protein